MLDWLRRAALAGCLLLGDDQLSSFTPGDSIASNNIFLRAIGRNFQPAPKTMALIRAIAELLRLRLRLKKVRIRRNIECR